MQKNLIDKFKRSLISFTLNIPGKIKDNSVYRDIHIEGMKIIKEALQGNSILDIYIEEIEKITGREGYIVVDLDADSLKKLMIDIEDIHPLGRIFDIDVFNSRNEQISRTELGENTRRCLLCDLDARICMREKNHTYESLIQFINNTWEKYEDN